MAFPGFDQFWNEAVARAGIDKQAGDYYGQILQYYIEEQGTVGPSIKSTGRPGEYVVTNHFGVSHPFSNKKEAYDFYEKAESDWERNTYLGRAHKEMEEDIESADLAIQNALKQYQTTLSGISGKEASEKAAHQALMKDYLRQREQETAELSLDKAVTKREWDDWQAEEQIDWRNRRKKITSDLASTYGRGGRAAEQFGTASRERFGSIGRREAAYEQILQQLQLAYKGDIGAIASKEELQRIAYQRALQDYKQQKAQAALTKNVTTGEAGLSKKRAGSLYDWALGRAGIEERAKRRDLAAQRAEYVDKAVAQSQAQALASYTSARSGYEQQMTGY